MKVVAKFNANNSESFPKFLIFKKCLSTDNWSDTCNWFPKTIDKWKKNIHLQWTTPQFVPFLHRTILPTIPKIIWIYVSALNTNSEDETWAQRVLHSAGQQSFHDTAVFCVIMAYYTALGRPAITKPSDQRLLPLGF